MNQTRPNQQQAPEKPAVSDAKADPFERIEAVDFAPSAASGGARVKPRHIITGLISLVLAALAFVGWYLFTGQSVLIEFDPPAENMQVSGGMLNLKLADQWLLRPGDYTVTADKSGYRPFEAEFTVSDSDGQSFLFNLIKKPGFLNILLEPDVPATVRLADLEPELPIERMVLEPGTYPVQIEADRFQPYETTVEIEGADVEQNLVITLEPAWADISLISNPVGATLHVDGEPVGETPLVAEVIEGRRVLELRLEGYKPWQKELRIAAQQPMDLGSVVLEKADYLVKVSSTPGGASITIDGEYRGQTPAQLALKPGQSYQVGLSKPGYRSNQRKLEVIDGDNTSLQVRLNPILGEVIFSGQPAGAEVYINGRLAGGLNETLSLPAHPQSVEIKRDGYESYRGSVTPNPNLEQRVQVDLLTLAEVELAKTPNNISTINNYQLKLIQPSGIFRLGSPRREQGRRSNELIRQVQLSRPFYIGTKEISNADFAAFDAQHDSGVIERNTLALKEQPVVRLSWDQAARFCNWLSERDGLPAAYKEEEGLMVPVVPLTTGYRMPTEAEWAIVSRYEGQSGGRSAKKYSWGPTMPPPQGSGNFSGTESSNLVSQNLSTYQDEHPASAQVGSYQPNTLGLYDLSGNVREWMHDFYQISIGGTGQIPSDPSGPPQGTTHTIRGSGWRSASITELRLAFRDEGVEGRDDLGFRIARYAK